MHKVQIQPNYPLNKLNTLRLESTTESFICLTEVNALPQIKEYIDKSGLKFFTLGGGSNLILPEYYSGLVIYNQLKGISLIAETDITTDIRVMAGEVWDDFVEYTIKHSWFGLENLSLIPGTVGAAPIQNIGAYGVEVKDFIAYVEVYDMLTGQFGMIDNAQCNFGYRNSMFKTHPNYIVTSVVFRLRKTAKLNANYGDLAKALAEIEQPSAMDLRRIVIDIRTQKLPDPKLIGNVGSFFHNPILANNQVALLREKYPKLPVYAIDEQHSKVSAGWLIDNLGLKGYCQGNMGVYAKQALVLVNHAYATKTEVLDLATFIQEKVFAEYAVRINIEPIIVV